MWQGAASFFAMREYEKHEAANGQPPNHQFAKEVRILTGIALHIMQVPVCVICLAPSPGCKWLHVSDTADCLLADDCRYCWRRGMSHEIPEYASMSDLKALPVLRFVASVRSFPHELIS